MKKILLLLPLVFILNGCSLWPKKVEFMQDKVQKVPEATLQHKEVQKEAAEYVARKTKETVIEAVKTDASTNVLKPAIEAESVANSLAGSLGKPVGPWKQEAELLKAKLDRLDARLDSKLEDFKEDNDKNAGKKIEGTGLIQIGYFTQFIVIAIVFAFIWIAIKVLSILNPAAGAAVSVGSKVITGGIFGVGKKTAELATQMLHGGQEFKKRIEEEIEDPEMKQRIIDLFHTSHKINQSPENQEIIKKMIS